MCPNLEKKSHYSATNYKAKKVLIKKNINNYYKLKHQKFGVVFSIMSMLFVACPDYTFL